MAEIANSTVFTNGVTCNTTDLLQRAFQEVINDDDHEFVTFLTDGDASHTIHLTQAQAAELNLNFEVDSCANDQPDELSYQSQQHQQQQQQCQTTALNGYHNTQSQSKFDSASPGTPETIDYETARWSIDDKLNGHDADTASKPITIDDITSSSAKTIDFEPSTRSNVQALFIHSDSSKKAGLSNISSNFNEIQLAIDGKNIQQNFSTAASSSSSPQVLQKLPVFLPSSQFIIKPAQTILKTSKSIQLISNSKLINGNISTINSGNNQGSQHQNQNSVLLPKVSTLLNSVNSHVFKGTSVASQVVHGNSLSAQLLTPQIITCESSNQRVTNTNTGGNTSGQCNTSNNSNGNNNISIINNKNGNLIANGVRSQSLGNTQQIRLLPRVTGAIQETNAGQFTAVVNKTTAINESVNGKMTAGSLIGGKISTGVISRTAQFTPRMMTASIGKLATTATKVPINSLKSSITFPAGTTIRPQNFRSVNAGLIQRNGTSVSTPVSILKPQPKVVPKQNLGVGSPIPAALNGAGSLQKIVTVAPQSLSMDTVKRVQSNEVKRSSDLVMNKMDVKKPKTVGMLSSGTAGQSNLAKPLGSNENPIQIVQQGHTFHR